MEFFPYVARVPDFGSRVGFGRHRSPHPSAASPFAIDTTVRRHLAPRTQDRTVQTGDQVKLRVFCPRLLPKDMARFEEMSAEEIRVAHIRRQVRELPLSTGRNEAHAESRRLCGKLTGDLGKRDAVEALARNLPVDRAAAAEAHDDLRVLASTIKNDIVKSDALTELSKRLPPGGEAKAHAHLRASVSTIGRDAVKSRVLFALAEHLVPGDEAAAHGSLRALASTIGDDFAKAHATITLAKSLPPGDQAAAHEELRALASTIRNDTARFHVLAELSTRLPVGDEKRARASAGSGVDGRALP